MTTTVLWFPLALIFTHYIHLYRSTLSRNCRWCQLLPSPPPAQWNRCSPQTDRRLPAVSQTRANTEATNKSSFYSWTRSTALLCLLAPFNVASSDTTECELNASQSPIKQCKHLRWKGIKEDGGVVRGMVIEVGVATQGGGRGGMVLDAEMRYER